MSISALTAPSVATASSSSLVKLANGEYTAASVTKDQKDAIKLGLIREKDGNYGTSAPAATQSSSNVLSSLLSLTLGG